MADNSDWQRIIEAIRQSGLSIYESLAGRDHLRLSDHQLQLALTAGLLGLRLNYKLRTRSKVVKSRICDVLGYPVPKSFKKAQPRFPGQDFDVYTQKALNLQIWNEDVAANRRYVLVRLNSEDLVVAVRVISGAAIAALDKTGTLTSKFQAKSREPIVESVLVSETDTDTVQSLMATTRCSHLVPIDGLYSRLVGLEGTVFENPGHDQERLRGALLHALVQEALGEEEFTDSGQFPDVPSQLLELKLQMSATIDLGLISPDSSEQLGTKCDALHRDIRYAVYFATLRDNDVRLDHVIVITGADFFKFFRRFEGNIVNQKIQIPLPEELFW